MNLGFNPVHGERDQTHAYFRIKATHRLHQADVPFLNQVRLRQAVTGVITSDMNYKAQVRQDQRLSRIQIALVMQPFSQRFFLFCRQHRPDVGGPNVRFQVAKRSNS